MNCNGAQKSSVTHVSRDPKSTVNLTWISPKLEVSRYTNLQKLNFGAINKNIKYSASCLYLNFDIVRMKRLCSFSSQ